MNRLTKAHHIRRKISTRATVKHKVHNRTRYKGAIKHKVLNNTRKIWGGGPNAAWQEPRIRIKGDLEKLVRSPSYKERFRVARNIPKVKDNSASNANNYIANDREARYRELEAIRPFVRQRFENILQNNQYNDE
jgi:hypothetical protein